MEEVGAGGRRWEGAEQLAGPRLCSGEAAREAAGSWRMAAGEEGAGTWTGASWLEVVEAVGGRLGRTEEAGAPSLWPGERTGCAAVSGRGWGAGGRGDPGVEAESARNPALAEAGRVGRAGGAGAPRLG